MSVNNTDPIKSAPPLHTELNWLGHTFLVITDIYTDRCGSRVEIYLGLKPTYLCGLGITESINHRAVHQDDVDKVQDLLLYEDPFLLTKLKRILTRHNQDV